LNAKVINTQIRIDIWYVIQLSVKISGRRGRNHMVVGLTTTCASSVYHH
jgi:hypothetical protein